MMPVKFKILNPKSFIPYRAFHAAADVNRERLSLDRGRDPEALERLCLYNRKAGQRCSLLINNKNRPTHQVSIDGCIC